MILWLGNAALRYWRLGVPRSLAFDEVYYVPFAASILHNQPFFDAHPPLGKYWLALGVTLVHRGQEIWGEAPALAELMANPVTYRWLNAALGAGVPLVVGWVAWEWSRGSPMLRRYWFALLAVVCTSLNGLLLVESRLALLHVALVGFGLISVAAWGRSHHAQHPRPWRLLAGLALGASISIKWSGASYWLGLTCLIGCQLGSDLGLSRRRRLLTWGRWLCLVPAGVYSLCWLPYLTLTGDSFLGIHQTLWRFHQTATAAHPYASSWYTWPLMVRPIAYFYQGFQEHEPLGIGPPTPVPDQAIALYGMDNPLLGWLGTGAVIMLMVACSQRRGGSQKRLASNSPDLPGTKLPRRSWSVSSSIVITYLAHWLPWAWIQRTTFFYHYLPAALTADLALAWLLSRWLLSDRPSWRWAGWGILGVMLAGFGFWLPLWIGWPLSPEALQYRWWLPSWR